MANEVATLDHYCGGRLIFGIGAGWLADESEVMGVNFKRRWSMTREYVCAMKEPGTKPQASFAGEFVNFPAVKCEPKPRQKPHPPIHIGAGGMRASMERALRDTVLMGDGWAPLGMSPDALATGIVKLKLMCREAGRDHSKIEISMYAPVERDPKRLRDQYCEAGAHRLIFVMNEPTPSTWERQLSEIAQAGIQ